MGNRTARFLRNEEAKRRNGLFCFEVANAIKGLRDGINVRENFTLINSASMFERGTIQSELRKAGVKDEELQHWQALYNEIIGQ